MDLNEIIGYTIMNFKKMIMADSESLDLLLSVIGAGVLECIWPETI